MNIKFLLNGCDICFTAEAPEDITLKQLLKQCDKIKPDYCACGIRSLKEDDYQAVEIKIGYDNIETVHDNVSCTIEHDNVSCTIEHDNVSCTIEEENQ